MCEYLKYEFQVKHFLFYDCKRERFYRSQWSQSRWIFWIIKLVLLLYWFAWFVVSLVESSYNWWIFLTNWGVTTVLVYLITTFGVSTYGLYEKKSASRTQPNRNDISTVSGAVNDVKAEEAAAGDTTELDLRWFHKLAWILQSTAINIAFVITIAYWALLTPTFSAVSINTHAINSVIMLIDLFLHDIPVRLLHFYHTSFFAIAYTVFSLILHGANYESSIYDNVLDWQNRSTLAIGLCLGIIFIASLIAHSVTWGFHHLKFFIARQTVLREEKAGVGLASVSIELAEKDNPAYVE